LIGCGQPGRTGTNDGNLLVSQGQAFDFNLSGIETVRRKTLEVPDRHWGINFVSAASVFTAMGADAAQNSRKGEILHNDFKGPLVIALANHLNIALNI
jgi:hypothetical protein